MGPNLWLESAQKFVFFYSTVSQSTGIKVIIDFLKVFFGPDVGSFVGGCLSNFSSPANLQSLIWRRVVTAVSCRFTLPRLTSKFLQCDLCERFIFKNVKDYLSTGVVLSQPCCSQVFLFLQEFSNFNKTEEIERRKFPIRI